MEQTGIDLAGGGLGFLLEYFLDVFGCGACGEFFAELAGAQGHHNLGKEAEVLFVGTGGHGEEDDDVYGFVVERFEVDSFFANANADGGPGDFIDSDVGYGDAFEAGAANGFAFE